MNLPEKAVKEFQEIYKKKCGEELSFDEARIKATEFLEFFYFLTKPIKVKNAHRLREI